MKTSQAYSTLFQRCRAGKAKRARRFQYDHCTEAYKRRPPPLPSGREPLPNTFPGRSLGTRQTRLWIASITIVAALMSGCSSTEDEHAGATAPTEVHLPPYPFWSNEAVAVDEALLTELAGPYCSAEGGHPSSEAYFLGYLPLASTDLLCSDSPRAPHAQALFGNLYLSGYFGGIWLRDTLDSPHHPGLSTRERAQSMSGRLFFTILSTVARKQIELAGEGDPEALSEAAEKAIPGLLTIYGYNKGYIEVALENPPEGIEPPEDVLVCDSFLDCESPGIELETLDRFQPALDKLGDPPTEQWAEMVDKVCRYGEGSVEMGREVWEEILGESSFDESAYDLILALSAGYLLVSDVSVLAAMTAWADEDPEAGSCAALLRAGVFVWSAAYFMGLTSSEAPGTFPELTCGG